MTTQFDIHRFANGFIWGGMVALDMKLFFESLIEKHRQEKEEQFEEKATCTRCSGPVEDGHDDPMLGGVVCEECFEELYE